MHVCMRMWTYLSVPRYRSLSCRNLLDDMSSWQFSHVLRGLPASVFMFFACIFMCVSVFVCVFMCACICVCMYLCYKPLLVLYELPVKMWQEIGCEQGIRQGKFFWGGNELDGARNWVGANYWVVTCADRRSSMCRCRENVCACTNTKFSNAIIFTVKCMFIVTKKIKHFNSLTTMVANSIKRREIPPAWLVRSSESLLVSVCRFWWGDIWLMTVKYAHA